MKKIIAFIMVMIIAFGILCACGEPSDERGAKYTLTYTFDGRTYEYEGHVAGRNSDTFYIYPDSEDIYEIIVGTANAVLIQNY